MQAKVLRALQEQVVEPVGGQASVRVDVRVHRRDEQGPGRRDPAGPVPRGPVFPAQRHSDPRAAAARARRRRDAAGRTFRRASSRASTAAGRKTLSPDAVESLRAYAGPGNVRELRNVIERLMIMVPGDVIRRGDLPFLDVAGDRCRPPDPATSSRCSTPAMPGSARTSSGALAVFDGNISRTADALGLERSNLYKKMRGLGIAPGRAIGTSSAVAGLEPRPTTCVRRAEPGFSDGIRSSFQNLVAESLDRLSRDVRRERRGGCEADELALDDGDAVARGLALDGIKGARDRASSRSSSGSSTPGRYRGRRARRPWP